MKENYFILLGLNAEINDEEEIVNTINNKQNEWSKGRNHATKGTQYQQYLSYLPEIRRVLLNPKLRAEEANLAKKIKQEQAKNKQKILIDLAKNYIKNNEILEEDLNELLKVAEFKNLSREDTLKILKIKIAENISNFILDDNVQKLEQSTMNIIKEQLKVLNKIDLFDFLGVNINVGITELISKANEIYKTVSKNSNKTAEITAKTDLSNLCFTKIFKDEASKQIYIKTIDFEKIKELYNEIDASANIEKFIIADRFTAFVLKALNNKVTSIERAEYFIYQYCILKKYNLKFNYKYEYNKPIFCINCKQYNNPKNINCTNCKNSLNATCPKCNNNIINIGLKNCDTCGCDIELFINYKKLLKEADENYKNRLFLKVKQGIKNINWPENKLLNELNYQIENRLTDYYELIIEIESNIKIKNFELATNKINDINKLNLHEQEKYELINKYELEIIDFKNKSNAAFRDAEVELLNNNIEIAASYLEKSLNLWPQNPKAIKLNIDITELKILIKEIENLIKDKDVFSAWVKIHDIDEIEINDKFKENVKIKYKAEVEDIENKSCLELKNADSAIQQGNFENAKKYTKLAESYWPKNPDISYKIKNINEEADKKFESAKKSNSITAKLIGIPFGLILWFSLLDKKYFEWSGGWFISLIGFLFALVHIIAGWAIYPIILWWLFESNLDKIAEKKYKNNRYD